MNDHLKLNLSKLQKCDQDYSEMIITKGGRICQSCTKEIIDFTGMSNEQIALMHLQSEEPVCGYYSKKQINNSQNHDEWKIIQSPWWTLAGLTTLLALQPIQSVAEKSSTIVQFDHQFQDKPLIKPTSADSAKKSTSHIVSGEVTEQLAKGKKEIIPFANIMVKGASHATCTDLDGKYSLDVTDYVDSSNSVTLVFSYIGYAKVEKSINLSNTNNLNFNLTMDQTRSAIAFYVVTKPVPFYKKVWYFIRSPFIRR